MKIEDLVVINKEEFEAKFGHLLIGVNLDKYSKPLKGFIEDAFEAGDKYGRDRQESDYWGANREETILDKWDYLKQEIKW